MSVQVAAYLAFSDEEQFQSLRFLAHDEKDIKRQKGWLVDLGDGEALRILEAEGLVDHTPTRRSRVANPSVEELSQSMKVLATLEALGGELACTQADKAQLEAISDLNRRMHEKSGKASSIDFFSSLSICQIPKDRQRIHQ